MVTSRSAKSPSSTSVILSFPSSRINSWGTNLPVVLNMRCRSSWVCSRAKNSALLKGLAQVVIGSGPKALDQVFHLVFSRHHDDRQLRGQEPLPYMLTDFIARHAGHHHIEQHQVKVRRLLQYIQCFLSTAGQYELKATLHSGDFPAPGD